MSEAASAARDLVRLVRPRDWLKNVFVLLPLPFALGGGSSVEPAALALGLVAMSLASSAAYAFNDWWDAGRDRRHPRKRERPLAAGRLPAAAGPAVSLGLAAAGTALALGLGPPPAGLIVTSYLGLQILYTLYGKHVPLVDVFLLTSGFVLRVVLGCALVGVPPSNWLLLCSSSLALLLALAKRRADMVQGLDERHRPSLAGYSRAFLDQGLAVSAGLTITAYALYCMDSAVLAPGREFASLPFVVFGVMECLRIVHAEDGGGSPVDMLLSSPVLLACSFAWAGAILLSVRVSVAI
ncbi:MAG: UbiA prenyltransferase family protein [Acidobacteria bacterium]|nr:UbiA prenyltransferase family protein [Acidobacteriota bacterium]